MRSRLGICFELGEAKACCQKNALQYNPDAQKEDAILKFLWSLLSDYIDVDPSLRKLHYHNNGYYYVALSPEMREQFSNIQKNDILQGRSEIGNKLIAELYQLGLAGVAVRADKEMLYLTDKATATLFGYLTNPNPDIRPHVIRLDEASRSPGGL